MDKVCLIGGLRSYIGLTGGVYRHVPAELLGAAVLKAVTEKYNVVPQQIICGNGVGAGGNIARLAALEAGLPESIPAVSVDVQCGSGLEAVAMAAAKIEAGEADIIIAGGFESTSTQPRRGYNANHPDYKGEETYSVAKFMPGIHRETVMLEGAELTAEREHISRAESDSWVLRSHKLAAQAAADGALSDIIVPCFGAVRDEGIRPKMSQRLLDRLPCVLEGGRFTNAANACLTNDGAAFVLLASENYAKAHNLAVQAKVRHCTAAGGDPLVSPKSAILALNALLQRAGLSHTQIDCFELNEAFAVIDIMFSRAFPGHEDGYNVFGGALAYGHPYGASGAIILLHLLKSLQKRGGRFGAASVAAAGGVGTALLIERC